MSEGVGEAESGLLCEAKAMPEIKVTDGRLRYCIIAEMDTA